MKHQSGQTLIEVIAALAVAVIILTAITQLVTKSLNSSQFSKDQNIATEYAQQAMETLRQIRDADYSSFLLLASDDASFSTPNKFYCLDEDETDLVTPGATTLSSTTRHGRHRTITVTRTSSTCGKNVADEFSRKVRLVSHDSRCKDPGSAPPTYGILAEVLVEWEDARCASVPSGSAEDARLCHHVDLVTCLSNIR